MLGLSHDRSRTARPVHPRFDDLPVIMERQEVTDSASTQAETRSATGREIRILLVDDEVEMQTLIRSHFADHGVEVVAAFGRGDAIDLLDTTAFDLVVLDLRLGSENGLDLLRELRTRSDIPVIITTGHRRDEIDRVVGLELGADDYLIKPVGLRELLARVRVVLRRAESRVEEPEPGAEARHSRFAGWSLDRRLRRLTDPTGRSVGLTKGEYALLIAFLDAPQRPLSREHLLQATRIHEDIYDRSIDVQILRLRRKLETDPSAPRMIVTERGVGYVFDVPVETVRRHL